MRALRILKEADLVLAEDTRTSGILLKHFDIHVPMQSYHKFNEHQTAGRFVDMLRSGSQIAVVTDAGTPGISDPGFLLAREAIKAGIEVITLPGATAFVPALVSSGLPCDKFCFEGFLPQKKGRATRLEELKNEPRTIIFYESPHRVVKTLEQFCEVFGSDRPVSVCREISKLHEESVRGTVEEVLTHFKEHEPRGEFVIVLGGSANEPCGPTPAPSPLGSTASHVSAEERRGVDRTEETQAEPHKKDKGNKEKRQPKEPKKKKEFDPNQI